MWDNLTAIDAVLQHQIEGATGQGLSAVGAAIGSSPHLADDAFRIELALQEPDRTPMSNASLVASAGSVWITLLSLMSAISNDFSVVIPPITTNGAPHRSLEMDSPDGRSVHSPELGEIIEFPAVHGLHHTYLRKAA